MADTIESGCSRECQYKKEVCHVYAAKRNRFGNGNRMERFRPIVGEVHPLLDADIKEAKHMAAKCTDEWCAATEHVIDELSNALFSISEPRWSDAAVSKKIKELKHPQSLQAIAGTCPITKASGKSKQVLFRHACDHEFRAIVQQWAKASLKCSVWATTYFRSALPSCRSISHAYRCLANRWLAIIWKMWQTRQPYNEAYHLGQRAQDRR